MKELEFHIEKVSQPIGEFYIAKIDSKTLYSMSKADILQISKNTDSIYEGIQRELNPSKVRKIKKYLKYHGATFPNSIILNLNKNNLISLNNNKLKIIANEDTFSIIDGQHRLEGLKGFDGIFDLNCSIFIGLSESEQSRIFVTINSEQTKVNPSLSIFQEYEDDIYTPRKFAAEIAVAFATDKESKWSSQIKLLGFKDEFSENGKISLSAFYRPILKLIYDDEDYYEIRNVLYDSNNDLNVFKNDIEFKEKYEENKRYPLWDFYLGYRKDAVYKILNNYFGTLAEVLHIDWDENYEDRVSGIIKKTTGYNAVMYLFEDLLEIGLSEGNLKKEFFETYLTKLKELNGMITSDRYSASGLKSSQELYSEFRKLIFENRVSM